MNDQYSSPEWLIDLSNAIQHGDSEWLEEAIRFLEFDSNAFRTGYAKEHVWKYLVRRYKLDSASVDRLCKVALQNLEKPIRREFWAMCRAISRIAPNNFWAIVAEQTTLPDKLIAQRASYLYAYRNGTEAGEMTHHTISVEWNRRKKERNEKS